MKKFLLISSIVLAVFIAGAFIYAQYNNLPEPLGLNLLEQNFQPEDLLIAEKEGIQVTVEEVKRENNQTVVKLTMDNHVYNLSEFDIKNFSSLNGVKPSAYQILGDQVGGPASPSQGGHHLEASLIFPGELDGKLIVGFKDDLKFEFDL